MFAKRYVAVRIAALLLPGLLFAMPASVGGIARLACARRIRSCSANGAEDFRRRPSAIVNRPPPIFPRTCRRTQPSREREKRDRELDAKLQICRGC